VLDAHEANPELVTVYTDGGCDLKKEGIGAWAYRIEAPGAAPEEATGCMLGTTNNRMEMMAVLQALENLEIGRPIRIGGRVCHQGPDPLVPQLDQERLEDDGRQARAEPDLWERLIALYKLHTVTLEHVKGHSGHDGNERVDTLCTQTMQAGHKALLDGAGPETDWGAAMKAAA
jgi:ribonuclease HI